MAYMVGKWLVCTLNEWIEFYQTCTSILLRHGKELIRFGVLYPNFKVIRGLRLLENDLSAPYLQNESMDFDQTCPAILLRQGQELIRFDDLDHIFKVTLGLRFWKMAPHRPHTRKKR